MACAGDGAFDRSCRLGDPHRKTPTGLRGPVVQVRKCYVQSMARTAGEHARDYGVALHLYATQSVFLIFRRRDDREKIYGKLGYFAGLPPGPASSGKNIGIFGAENWAVGMAAKLSIVGITRYSVLHQRSFAGTRGLAIDDARNLLWRPERLAHREQLFRAIALPSLDQFAARYHNFQHVIMLSHDLTAMFKQRIVNIAAARPWLQIVESRPGDDFSVVKPLLRTIVGDSRAFVFRLDDDDAMAPQYYLDAILANANCTDGTVLSPDEGYMVRPAWKGVSLKKERIPFVSAGLGVYTRGPDPISIHDLGNQNKLAKKFPVIHVKGRLWLRSKTLTSDTVMQSWKKWRYFPVSLTELGHVLESTFPGLSAQAVIDAITRSAVSAKPVET